MTRDDIEAEVRKHFHVNSQAAGLTKILFSILDKLETADIKPKTTLPNGKAKFRYHNRLKCGNHGRIAHVDSCKCED